MNAEEINKRRAREGLPPIKYHGSITRDDTVASPTGIGSGYDPYSSTNSRVRREALDLAIKSGPYGNPADTCRAAKRFAEYLTGQDEQPAGPLLPPDLVASAIRAPADRLFAIQTLLAERERQEAKGYTAERDDGLTYGGLVGEAIRRLDTIPIAERRQHGPRAILEAAALLIAELERVSRADLKAGMPAYDAPSPTWRAEGVPHPDGNGVAVARVVADDGRTHGSDSAINDEQPAASIPPAPSIALDREDYEDMRHALGLPMDPLRRTFRNYFAASKEGRSARRFRELATYWAEAMPNTDGKMAYFSVTFEGRQLLACYYLAHPEYREGPSVKDNRDQPMVGEGQLGDIP